MKLDHVALYKAAWAHYRAEPDEKVQAAILAYCDAADVVMVPREPTDGMCLAGYEAERSYGMCDNKRELARQECEHIYAAMIRASQEEE